jgi:hypothetical protein
LITWEEVRNITQTLATAPAGEARTMKVTLIGRPEKIETRQQCVVFKISILRQSRRFYDCWPLKGA